jgi:hypothetical protein
MTYRYGEFLFKATSGSILECLNEIHEEDVRDTCDQKVFRKGKEYYIDGMVEDFTHNPGVNTVDATVNGKSEYSIQFYLEDERVYSSCDCPYDGVCKHTVAALLYIINESPVMNTLNIPVATKVKSLDFLKRHLNSFSKDDLVIMVMKFAPKNFIEEVFNREVNGSNALAIIRDAEEKIRRILENENLHYDPRGMESALMTKLNKLKGLEERVAMEIGELIFFIIRSIDDLMSDGCLYIDNYYQEEYFESVEFCEYVVDYVKQQPFEGKKTFLRKMDEVLSGMEFDTFSPIQESYPRFFSESERPDLKNFVLHESDLPPSMISELYNFIETELSFDEKIEILKNICDTKQQHFITYCRLLYEKNRFSEIISLIKSGDDSFNHMGSQEIAAIYLDAAQKLDLNMDEVSLEVAEHCPLASVLQKIKNLKGTVGDGCEQIVRQTRPEELLKFYQDENRLKDALRLVQDPHFITSKAAFAFFRKNMKIFPAETESFMERRIKENLKDTGNHYYEIIAESIDVINRVNPEQSQRIAEEIRANYKRRRNLMELIRKY